MRSRDNQGPVCAHNVDVTHLSRQERGGTNCRHLFGLDLKALVASRTKATLTLKGQPVFPGIMVGLWLSDVFSGDCRFSSNMD